MLSAMNYLCAIRLRNRLRQRLALWQGAVNDF
jgi:hypothetical protein